MARNDSPLLFLFVAASATIAIALASGGATAQESGLVELARQFPNLTDVERATLLYADVANINRGAYAVAGTSTDPVDPSNDAKNGDRWGPERLVRASLIRWLCVTPQALAQVDPVGIRLLGARIVGSLNLSYIH